MGKEQNAGFPMVVRIARFTGSPCYTENLPTMIYVALLYPLKKSVFGDMFQQSDSELQSLTHCLFCCGSLLNLGLEDTLTRIKMDDNFLVSYIDLCKFFPMALNLHK